MEVIKFEAPWCTQCKQADTMMKAFSHPVTKVDVDVQKDMIEKYNIAGLPTYIVLNDGVEVGRVNGFTPNIMGRILDLIENV